MENLWDSGLDRKLHILADAAKYDVSCTSSGVERKNGKQGQETRFPAGSVTALLQMAAVFLC